MPISNVSKSPYLESAKINQKSNNGQVLGKDDFLLLLVTQMQYQDPLSPMENTEYISQLAQFSELEAMQNISLSYLKTQALNLVGKTVSVQISNTEEAVGKVDMVTFDGSEVIVSVGEFSFPLDKIKRVLEDFNPPNEDNQSDNVLDGDEK